MVPFALSLEQGGGTAYLGGSQGEGDGGQGLEELGRAPGRVLGVHAVHQAEELQNAGRESALPGAVSATCGGLRAHLMRGVREPGDWSLGRRLLRLSTHTSCRPRGGTCGGWKGSHVSTPVSPHDPLRADPLHLVQTGSQGHRAGKQHAKGHPVGKEQARSRPTPAACPVGLSLPCSHVASVPFPWPLCSGTLETRVEPSLSQPRALPPGLDPAEAHICPGARSPLPPARDLERSMAYRADAQQDEGTWAPVFPTPEPGLGHTAECPSRLHTTVPWDSAPLVSRATLPGDWL